VLVLDEADEMFSMGFAKELNAIMDALPRSVSSCASRPHRRQRAAHRPSGRMKQPAVHHALSDQVGAAEISHYFYMVLGRQAERAGTRARGRGSRRARSSSATPRARPRPWRGTCPRSGFNADWLNGDSAAARARADHEATREGQAPLHGGHDVAARGIDISHLTHVINFGFPSRPSSTCTRTAAPAAPAAPARPSRCWARQPRRALLPAPHLQDLPHRALAAQRDRAQDAARDRPPQPAARGLQTRRRWMSTSSW
jgi:ATP-dependent RNA helicase DeaD